MTRNRDTRPGKWFIIIGVTVALLGYSLCVIAAAKYNGYTSVGFILFGFILFIIAYNASEDLFE